MHRWTSEHGPDKLYEKFTVIQRSTGKELPKDEFVFVLRPERDEAACTALVQYAIEVKDRSPNLADEIFNRMLEIREANDCD